MTNRDAIALLQQHILIHDITESGRWENVNKAMEMGIQALEKQEPKKPKQLGNIGYLFCVECGHNLETHWLGCPHCLTPTDWSE